MRYTLVVLACHSMCRISQESSSQSLHMLGCCSGKHGSQSCCVHHGMWQLNGHKGLHMNMHMLRNALICMQLLGLHTPVVFQESGSAPVSSLFCRSR